MWCQLYARPKEQFVVIFRVDSLYLAFWGVVVLFMAVNCSPDSLMAQFLFNRENVSHVLFTHL